METTPITRDSFRELFRASRRAFHLELKDSYGVADEDGPFRQWLAGEPDDHVWRIPWLTFVREVSTAGVAIQRARVVTEPHTDYVRWEMALDPQNIEAGEEIRYLPRRLAEDIVFPPEDCWLFDDDTLVLSLFLPDGGSGGFALADDQAALSQYRDVRDQVWSRAIPYADYTA